MRKGVDRTTNDEGETSSGSIDDEDAGGGLKGSKGL